MNHIIRPIHPGQAIRPEMEPHAFTPEMLRPPMGGPGAVAQGGVLSPRSVVPAWAATQPIVPISRSTPSQEIYRINDGFPAGMDNGNGLSGAAEFPAPVFGPPIGRLSDEGGFRDDGRHWNYDQWHNLLQVNFDHFRKVIERNHHDPLQDPDLVAFVNRKLAEVRWILKQREDALEKRDPDGSKKAKGKREWLNTRDGSDYFLRTALDALRKANSNRTLAVRMGAWINLLSGFTTCQYTITTLKAVGIGS